LLRLSAAVLVDGKYEEVAVAGGGVVDEAQAAMKSEKVFKQLTPEMLAQVEGVVKSAIGYDSARGDVVTVENIPFFQADDSLKAELDKASEINAWFRYAALSVPILAILIFGVFVLRPMMKFLTSNPETEIDITRLLPEGMPMEALSMNAAAAPNRGAPAGGQPAAAEGQPALAEAGNKSGLPDLSGPIDMGQLDEIMAESSRIVKENPTQAALLIRYWLNEGHL
jgi:flagellar M-ring protein FliF